MRSIANITRVFNEEQKFPEMNCYLISKLYADYTGAGKTADKTVLTTDNVLEVFDAMMTYMDNKRVPRAGRILYVTPDTRTLITNAKQIVKTLDVSKRSEAVKRAITSIDEVEIPDSVPSDMMKTAYDFTEGWQVDTAADQINMCLVHPLAVMSRKAANIISAQVIMKPDCVLGLATGSTPVGTYAQLVEWYKKGDLDFSEVKTVNLDEYKGLDQSNDQSYFYFMAEHLFDKVNIDFQNVNIPNGMETDADKECARYEAKIKALGGVDLQLLGIGHNGHIGFNEPNGQFDRTTHCVNLTQSTIEANKRFFASEEDVPRQAYTMGIKTIMQANKILMVASGEDKAEIVKRAFFGPITPEVPASVLQLHNDVTLVGDEAALSLIGSCQS